MKKNSKTTLEGKIFGRLNVLNFAGRNKQYDSLWDCVCECGNKVKVRGGVLKNGHTKSCGCLQRDRASKAKTTHGLSGEKLYKVWGAIKERCYNPNNRSFKDYGFRGIKMCSQWKTSFKKFYNWAIENGYKEGLTIERHNVNGNYTPKNCGWIPKKDQSKNRTNSVRIEYNGDSKTSTEWSEITNIPSQVITQRVRRGWSSERTLTTKI